MDPFCGRFPASWRTNVKSQEIFSELIRQERRIVDNFVTIRNRHTGEILRLSRVRDAQGQIVLNLDGSLPPRASGPPLHVHFHQREEGKVKSGTLGAQAGKEKILVLAGGTAVFAAGTRHKWWNAGDDQLEFSGQAIPAVDLDRYLHSPRAVAPSQLTVDCDSAPSHSTHRFPCHSVHRARPGQIPWIELARFARVVPRCSAWGR
jgi:Cupin domain